jgi:hypothetical protein
MPHVALCAMPRATPLATPRATPHAMPHAMPHVKKNFTAEQFFYEIVILSEKSKNDKKIWVRKRDFAISRARLHSYGIWIRFSSTLQFFISFLKSKK